MPTDWSRSSKPSIMKVLSRRASLRVDLGAGPLRLIAVALRADSADRTGSRSGHQQPELREVSTVQRELFRGLLVEMTFPISVEFVLRSGEAPDGHLLSLPPTASLKSSCATCWICSVMSFLRPERSPRPRLRWSMFRA